MPKQPKQDKEPSYDDKPALKPDSALDSQEDSAPSPSTEDLILEAAMNVIVAHGYAGATSKRIAQAAGVNEVTLFRKFGNKHALLLEALRREAQTFKNNVIYYSGDLETDLERMVRSYQELLRRRGAIFLVFLSEWPRHPELREGMSIRAELMRQVLAVLQRYQQEGALRDEPVIHLALALIGPIFAAGITSQLNIVGLDVTIDPKTYVQGFLTGRKQP